MNKKFAYISIAMMAFIGMSSCSDEDLFSPRDTQAKFTLTLPGQDVLTRATDPGLDTFNENTVATVDLFFYHTGETNQNAVLRKTLKASEIARNATSSNAETGMYVYDLTSSIGITELRTIFSNYDSDGAHTCEVYAIVNLPSDATITDTDIESLKQVELTCTAFGTLENAANAQYKKGVIPANFVMSGQSSTITLDATNKRKLVGNIDVFRSASKVTLELTEVKEHFTDANGNVWDSRTGDITIGMKHGQTVGYVEAEEHNISGDFTTRNIHMVPGTWINGGTATGHYKTDVPLYTYPNDWSNDLSHRTSLLVCVWWKNTSVAGSSYQPTYYEIPISDEDEKLLRNYHYRIQLSIGIIGSLVEEEPVVLRHCSYVILPWGSNKTILADMNEVRYLVVDETEIHMDNIIARSINYSSSHRIDTIKKHLYVRDLQDVNATWRELPADGFRIVVKEPTDGSGTSYLTVEHDLVNNMDEYSDYTQFKMEFDVYHDDQDPETTKYIEHIIAYQTPMIYAESEMNSNYVEYLNGQTNNYNDNRGYMWINNGTDASTYGGQNGISSNAGNKNPNRYIIKATALTSDSYIIGDPRTTYVNNELTTANIGTAREGAYSWSYVQTTNSLTTAESWSRHFEETYETGNYTYYTYAQYQANPYNATSNPTGIRRYEESRENRSYVNLPWGDSWDNHTSEASAYHPNNSNYYYWRVQTSNGWWTTDTYYRVRYGIPETAIRYFNTLMYYHPTDENNDRTANMISPEFMIASSYGVTSDITKENARKRCASYQEDGYPAGRWRVPTQAEIEYIVQLSAWGKIPILFGYVPTSQYYGDDATYWSANGVINVNSQTGDTNMVNVPTNQANTYTSAVRCVYDTWYWGRDEDDKCTKTEYTWGDKTPF